MINIESVNCWQRSLACYYLTVAAYRDRPIVRYSGVDLDLFCLLFSFTCHLTAVVMDFFLSCCAIVCGGLMCYVVAYILHGWPVECPSAARMDSRTILITGKTMRFMTQFDAF